MDIGPKFQMLHGPLRASRGLLDRLTNINHPIKLKIGSATIKAKWLHLLLLFAYICLTLRNNAGQSSGELSEYQDPPVVTAAPLSPQGPGSYCNSLSGFWRNRAPKMAFGLSVLENFGPRRAAKIGPTYPDFG